MAGKHRDNTGQTGRTTGDPARHLDRTAHQEDDRGWHGLPNPDANTRTDSNGSK